MGPPDWFLGDPEDPSGSAAPESARPDPVVGEAPGSAAELPGLRPASELTGGRRRRRTALAEVPPGSADPAAPDGPSEEWAPAERPVRSGRRRKGRSAAAGSDGSVDSAAVASAGAARSADEAVDPAARAREICLRLLTGTARTRKQLADALHKREIPPEVAEQVLTRLTEVGLIDDAAFAEAWVEARHGRRGLSRRALAQELRTRGVAADLVDRAVARLDADDEYEAARALVERRIGTTRGLDRDTRIRRLVAALARRGYPEGLAFRVVLAALEAEGDDTGGGQDDW